MKKFSIFLLIIIIQSCTGFKTANKKLKPINTDFSAYVQTEPYFVKSKSKSKHLTSIFQIPYNPHDSVKLNLLVTTGLKLLFPIIRHRLMVLCIKNNIFLAENSKKEDFMKYTLKKNG